MNDARGAAALPIETLPEKEGLAASKKIWLVLKVVGVERIVSGPEPVSAPSRLRYVPPEASLRNVPPAEPIEIPKLYPPFGLPAAAAAVYLSVPPIEREGRVLADRLGRAGVCKRGDGDRAGVDCEQPGNVFVPLRIGLRNCCKSACRSRKSCRNSCRYSANRSR